jgi:hypothetical protein
MIIRGTLDAMAGTNGEHPPGGPLSPEQRARLQEVITAELRRAWDEAVAAGVPADRLAEVVERRRREILSAVARVEDAQHGGDDAVENHRVGD